jgi:hypothetical protein
MTRRRKPVVRVFRSHNDAGWVLPDFTDLADCTSNHIPDNAGQPPCTAPAMTSPVVCRPTLGPGKRRTPARRGRDAKPRQTDQGEA